MSEADELSEELAGELHDGVVQWLVGAKMQAEGLRYQLINGQAIEVERVESLIRTLTSGIHEARRLMRGLSGPMIENGLWCQPLRDELQQLVDQLQSDRNQSVKLNIDFGEECQPLPTKLAETAYRLIRESVWNALRHARATNIDVAVQNGVDQLVISVNDNGRGFDIGSIAADRMGVRGLSRRAESVGGSASLDSAPGAGTRITFHLPT